MSKKFLSKVCGNIVYWLGTPAGLVRSYYYYNIDSLNNGKINHKWY